MECYCYMRNVQDVLTDGKTPYERWRTTQGANDTFWSTGCTSSDFTQGSRKYYLISFLTTSQSRGESGRTYSDSRSGRFGKLGAFDVYPRRINAKEILIRQKDDEFIFPFADGTPKSPGRDYAETNVSVENFKVNRESLNRLSQQMTLKPVPTSGRFRSDFIYRHHNEPRVQLYVPKEETFLIPLKYIHVTRSTHTDLDVMQEKRIGDCWNVDSNRNLSDSWKGFTKFTLLKEKLPKGQPKGQLWSGKDSSDYQTRSCMARSMVKNR